MSNPSYGTPFGPSAWPGPARPSRLPVVLSIVAIVIGLVFGAIAVAAYFKATPKAEAPASKVYSEQEMADTKKAVCDAYAKADRAIKTTGGESEARTQPLSSQ